MEKSTLTDVPIVKAVAPSTNGKIEVLEKEKKNPKGPTKFGIFQGVFTLPFNHFRGYHVFT